MKKSRFVAGLTILTVMIALVVFTGPLQTAAAGQGASSVVKDSPAATPTPYRPGATNPVKNPARLYLMKDDILATMFGHLGGNTLTRNWDKPTNTDLTTWANDTSAVLDQPDYGNGLNKNVISPIALASGRITSPLKDDVVGAYYYIDGAKVKPYVFFVDNPEVNTKNAAIGFLPMPFADDASHDNYYSIDIAVGDVDRKLNADGEYNDEIVVAFRWIGSAGHWLCVAVLDKDLNIMDWDVPDSYLDYPKSYSGFTHPYFSVTMGDYDNDGLDEIAAGFRTEESSGENQKYEIDTWDFVDQGLSEGDHYYYELDSGGGNFQYNVVDLTSGDFNGDGIDEIAVAISSFQPLFDYVDLYNLTPYLLIFTTDEDLNLDKRGSWHPSQAFDFYQGCVRGAGITSGLFKYNPAAGFTTARRQIAMSCISWQGSFYLNVMTFEVNDNFTPTIADNLLLHPQLPPTFHSTDRTSIPKITAGNFKGIDTETVTEQIAVSYADDRQPVFAVFDVSEALKLSLKYHGAFNPGHSDTSDQEFMSVPIVAADRDGNGFYLGAPIHLKIPSLLRANYVVQEPPKHLDYLPDDNDNWQVVRVSRDREFYSSFEDTDGESLVTTHQDRTNFDIGGSEKASAKETIKTDVGLFKVTVTSKQSEKLAYDYDSETTKLNGTYNSVQGSAQYNADRDDYVQIQYKVMDVWRYPIYGLKTQEKKNGFYEVVMPGPTIETLDAWGLDLADYYQPLHENGNILSYPQISDENFPEDLGSFTVDGEDIQSAMSKNDAVETWGSGSGKRSVEWEKDSWATETKSHTHKLNFNADFQLGFRAVANEVFEKEKLYEKVDLSFHVNKSWSEKDFSKNSMSSTKGISLFFPSNGDSDQAYNFKPVVYSTTDGTLKLAYAVDVTGSTQGIWWQRHYHGQPDLALNLPQRFHWVSSDQNPDYLGTWYVGKDRQARSRMRRLFLLHNEPKTEDTERLFVASAPTAGDVIYVLTTVYNYSLDTATGMPTKVRFSYAEYDPDLKDRAPILTTIGEVVLDSLGPLEHRDVYVKWDTTGLGGETPDTGQAYVIYVTVDPNNEVQNEIHELYVMDQSPPPGPCPTKDGDSAPCGIFCGSNNQGYWPWDNSFMIFSAKQNEIPGDEAGIDISIEPTSLAIGDTPESEVYGGKIMTHVPYRFKVTVVASETDKAHRDVFFYDNDRVFSAKRSFGLNQGENDFSSRWTPTEPGQHTIKVMIVEDEDDLEPGNNTASLDVEVLDEPPTLDRYRYLFLPAMLGSSQQ
jgi:hypothetical protein